MAEITMCRDAECPRTKDCLRFKSVPSEWQSYAKFNWYVAGVKENGDLSYSWVECDGFWEIQAYVGGDKK